MRDLACSWVSFQWALPGVVVGVVVPFSVSVGNAFQLLVSNVVVGISVGSASVDSFFSGDESGWLVHGDSCGGSNENTCEFHFNMIITLMHFPI